MLQPPVPRRVIRVAGLIIALWYAVAGAVPTPVPFELREPPEGARVRAGSSIPVQVSIGPESGTRRVSYFWYLDEAEPDPLQSAVPALTADGGATPPYGGWLTVPVDAVGRLRLLAVAEIAQGRLGTHLDFDERMLVVEPPAGLDAIELRWKSRGCWSRSAN